MEEAPRFKEEELFTACTFVGSLSDLSPIDFSFLNLKFIDIQDEKSLKEYFDDASVDDWSERNIELLRKLRSEFAPGNQMYLLTPIKLECIEEEVFFECRNVLRIIFPSDIQIRNVIHFQFFDKKYLSYTSYSEYPFHYSGFDYNVDYFLLFLEETVPDINNFIKLYFDRKDSISYLNMIVFNYLASIKASPHLEFISLCICLESLVVGANDISYRIRRNLAVLCGDKPYRSELIFKNVKNVYDLRSRIVHGSKYEYEQLKDYLIYLRALISRMIIEIILHNITDLVDLDKKLTSTGFGENSKLSENYTNLKLNINTYVEIISKELPKVK